MKHVPRSLLILSIMLLAACTNDSAEPVKTTPQADASHHAEEADVTPHGHDTKENAEPHDDADLPPHRH